MGQTVREAWRNALAECGLEKTLRPLTFFCKSHCTCDSMTVAQRTILQNREGGHVNGPSSLISGNKNASNLPKRSPAELPGNLMQDVKKLLTTEVLVGS